MTLDMPALIERFFPVLPLSAESYKERMAGASQTLTGLGKWWGRKPLVLVRAVVLGVLLPVSDDPLRDREVFLQLMTMDDAGLARRRTKSIPRTVQQALWQQLPADQRALFGGGDELPTTLAKPLQQELLTVLLRQMPYAQYLEYCLRPEEISGPDAQTWQSINAHLGTQAQSLPELVQELGERRFGRRPVVGDAFCGGGSIPFEAARLGCDVRASDLNPIATLLTWAALHVVGGSDALGTQVRATLEAIMASVRQQVDQWGIERNDQGWTADAFIYCTEVRDPESGWYVPLAPSWVIAEKYGVVAQLVPDDTHKRYHIAIVSGADAAQIAAAKAAGTVRDSRLYPPHGGIDTPIASLRRDLRMWHADDIVPRPDDVFQERLYCIRWIETYSDESGRSRTRYHFTAPDAADLDREQQVLSLLNERMHDWQAQGIVPNLAIEGGENNSQPIRERGWTHWHHLYTPRQLLYHGLIGTQIAAISDAVIRTALNVVGMNKLLDYNSKLCRWDNSPQKTAIGALSNTFANQALNTNYNYPSRGTSLLSDIFVRYQPTAFAHITTDTQVRNGDARTIPFDADIWITDPPYADAVNYEEITEYFVAWAQPVLQAQGWARDTQRPHAVKGNDDGFRRAMVECYQRLAQQMPANGLQVVMFTHKDAAVWADLALILWSAGLRVTAAWTIATETNSALKVGNYVQGTVILVLRKRRDDDADVMFLDEIPPLIDAEVRHQLDAMTQLDGTAHSMFNDTDYQLAAYAAALRVLTAQRLADLDPQRELLRPRQRGVQGKVEQVIANAIAIACDHLVPLGLPADEWRRLSMIERFYLKALSYDAHGERRIGMMQELARGFGINDYEQLLASGRANEARVATPSELRDGNLRNGEFATSLLRHVLMAIYVTTKYDDAARGLLWISTEVPNYWDMRDRIIVLLDYMQALVYQDQMPHWQRDGQSAAILLGAVRNHHL
ncbi:MAG: hypothetical protein RL076_2035 [Chloroflexota bacterium]